MPIPDSVHAMAGSVHAMAGENSWQVPTAPLEDFLIAYAEDDNWWWRIACGHHLNLFDAALDRIEELEYAIIHAADEMQQTMDVITEKYPEAE
jgi:hypothetical protein